MQSDRQLKLERKAQAKWDKVSVFLTLPADDLLWQDDDFWGNRFQRIVDSAAAATEEASYALR